MREWARLLRTCQEQNTAPGELVKGDPTVVVKSPSQLIVVEL